MVLDIADEGGARPYLLVGTDRGGFFDGVEHRGDRGDEVRASWATVGNEVFVGKWIEGGEEYLFSFDVSEAARAHAKQIASARNIDAMRYRLPGSYGTSRRR